MDLFNREKAKTFYLLMEDRTGQVRPRRAKIYPDGAIVWKKYLYYYVKDAIRYYPTKLALWNIGQGRWPAHLVHEDNALPLKDRKNLVMKQGIPNITPVASPNNPYEYESAEVAQKFRESNVVGGLAVAARKAQQPDMTQKYIMYGIAAIAAAIVIGFAIIINGMGILKLY